MKHICPLLKVHFPHLLINNDVAYWRTIAYHSTDAQSITLTECKVNETEKIAH